MKHHVILCCGLIFGASLCLEAATTRLSNDPMGGVPSRAELLARRARATNAPVSFVINPVTQKLEVRDIDRFIIEEYPTGTLGRSLKYEVERKDKTGNGERKPCELRLSYGRDDQRRLSVIIRPGPAQVDPVQISVFQRRLILPPGTSVMASMEKDGEVVTIEPCLTGTIYYLDTEPTPVQVTEDKVQLIRSKNLVRIGREVNEGKLPEESMVDAVIQGSLETEEKQTAQNNAGVAVGAWLQNAGVSLMGLPNPQTQPPATVVKVSTPTPELSAPAHAALTPNTDMTPVIQDRNTSTTPVTQNLKVFALRSEPGAAVAPQQPFLYEQGNRDDLAKASRYGLAPRPLEFSSSVPPAPAETLNQRPPGDVAGTAIWRTFRSFLGMPEAATVQQEADRQSGKLKENLSP